ncbi:MAG: carbohydrate kinase family protein [Candidatus Paceibacterota bacterium]
MFDIITIGGATRDMTFFTDKGKMIETPEDLISQRLLAFEFGAKIRSEDVGMNFGGGACNAAATFAKMGLSVSVVSRVGGDGNGKSILENIKRGNINTDFVQVDDDKNTAFSFIVVDSAGGSGERIVFSHRGASEKLEIRPSEIESAKWLYLTGLGENWKDNLEKIVETVGKTGIKLAWNPGVVEIASGKENLARFLKYTNILIINKDEAIELVKSDSASSLSGEDFNDIVKLIKALREWGVENVVITDGENGAYLFAGGEILKSAAFVKAQSDTTGAGDAFGSGLMAGYFLTSDWNTAFKYAVLNSGGEVSECGAQSGIMTREEIENNLDKIVIKKVE